MKMMRRLFTLLTALIVSFNILTVAAEGNPVQIDRSKKGSITMTLAEGDGKPVAGATFTLYKVGDIKLITAITLFSMRHLKAVRLSSMMLKLRTIQRLLQTAWLTM